MNKTSTVQISLNELKNARFPEAIFGKDADKIADTYRVWAKKVHEDLFPSKEKPLAHEAFLLLSKLYAQAQEKVKRKTYGDNKPLVSATINVKGATYELGDLLFSGDIADLYYATNGKQKLVVKICRSPRNNDLMQNEAKILKDLHESIENEKHRAYFPNLIDSFEIGDKTMRKRVNVFEFVPNLVSLEQVKHAYPNGLYGADAAWMWNRLLEALHLLHKSGYVHGAITPDRFLIIPENHHGMLWDFCFAAKNGGPIKAVSPRWKHIYAPEIFVKKTVDKSTDLYSASHCMEHIIETPIQPQLKGILKVCRLGRAHRIDSARTMHEDLAKTFVRLYGPKKFRPFTMPV